MGSQKGSEKGACHAAMGVAVKRALRRGVQRVPRTPPRRVTPSACALIILAAKVILREELKPSPGRERKFGRHCKR